MKIKIQQKMLSKLKNGGMHLLKKFVPMNEAVEMDLDKKVLESDQFKAWFEVVEGQDQEEIKPKRMRLKKDR